MRPDQLEDLARTFGTPCFLLDLDRLDQQIRRLQAALARSVHSWRVLYSVKTNYLPAVLERIRAAGMGCDCVSGYEMQLAIDMDFAPADIVLNGPLKTEDEIRFAVERDLLVNIDSVDEVDVIARAAQARGAKARVGIRLNPGRNVYPSRDPSFNAHAGWKAARSKFGWNVCDISTDELIDSIVANRHLSLVGVHCHLGSQITDACVFAAALDPILRRASAIRRTSALATINIGGGFGVKGMRRDRVGPLGSYLAAIGLGSDMSDPGPETEFRLDEFIAQIDELVERYDLRGVELACEPGRYLVSEAMQLLARVHSVKRTRQHGAWVVIDAGLNILPTAGPAERRGYRLARPGRTPASRFMLGGPLCYEGDVFSFDVELPADVRAGDLMVIADAGAYSVSRSTNFIRPRACVVALRGEKAALCWRRETYQDIFAFRVPKERSETSHGPQHATLHDHRPAAALESDAG